MSARTLLLATITTVSALLLAPRARSEIAGRPVLDVPIADAGGAALAFARATNGCIVAGFTEGVVVFDGDQWESVQMPEGAHSFRSLASASGDAVGAKNMRVYVGGGGSVGFIEQAPDGTWRHVSLRPALRNVANPDATKVGEVWHAHAMPDGAAFVTDAHVLRWTENKNGSSTASGHFEVFALPSAHRLHAFSVRGNLVVQQDGSGLLRLDPEGMRTWISEQDLPAKSPLAAIVPLADGRDLFVFGEEVFARDARDAKAPALWEKWSDAAAALKARYAVAACDAGGGQVAIASFFGGVMLVDLRGRVVALANESNGLTDDNVHALWSDGAGTVWIGMGAGMMRWRGAGAVTHFAMPGRAGAARKLVAHGGSQHLLTARGLYLLSGYEPARLARAPGLWWDAADIGGTLWAAGFGGLWRWEDAGGGKSGRLVMEHNVSADVFCLGELGDGGFLFLENESVKVLSPGQYGWVPRTSILKLDSAPVSMVSENMPSPGAQQRVERRFWISTLGGNVCVLAWNNARSELRLVKLMSAGTGLPAGATKPHLATVGGRIVLFGEGGIFTQSDDGALAFRPMESLEGFSGNAACGSQDGESFWIIRRREGGGWSDMVVRAIRDDTGKWLWAPLCVAGLERIRPVVDANVESRANGGNVLWIAGQGGVLRVEVARAPVMESPQPLPRVREQLTQNVRCAFYFPASQNAAAGAPLRYETKLSGAESAWTLTDVPARSVAALAAGEYVFAVRIADMFGRRGKEVSLRFVVPTPWYATLPAFVAYALALAVAVSGLMRWRMARLRRQNEKLNTLVDERTRELSLSNTARSDFLENVSHEIRNPLEGIVALVGLMDANATRERTLALARSLKACAQNLERVFNDVLGISRIEYGHVPVESRPFHMGALLDELRDMFSAEAEGRMNTIVVAQPQNWRDGFLGDEGKIKSIVGNFISNALKYAPATPVTVSVEELEGADARAEIIIEVTDDGPGVPWEEQALIFKKFVRGAKAKASKTGGTGIGLAACHALARLMHGSVGVESPARARDKTGGPGARFFLQLTLERATPGAASFGKPALPHGCRALIVDDQDYNRIALAGLLGQLGFETVCVPDGEAALTAWAAQRPEFVLIDFGLPDLCGTDVARRLRALPDGETSIIFGISAHGHPGMEAQAREADMDGFLLKPLTREKMMRAIACAQSLRKLDLSALETHARKNAHSLQDAARAWCDELHAMMAGVRMAVASDVDATALAKCVHRINSHAALLHAGALRDAADAWETCLRNGDGAEAEKWLARLEHQATKTERLLQTMLPVSSA